MKFLLLGWGSAGRRHESILRDLGHDVTTVDPAPGAEADYRKAQLPYVPYASGSRDEDTVVVTKLNFDGVLDCTPPDVRAGWNVPARMRFIEKPLGDPPDWAADEMVMLGFCYRHLPSLEMFVAELADVRVFSLLLVSGQHLPDWHDDDYRLHYHGMPRRGGVVLDSFPHSLFVARWILSDVCYVGSVNAKLSGLDIRTEDTAAVLLEALTGQPVYILADYLRKPRAFYVEAVTSDSVRRWKFDPDEADAMYRRQMEAFVEVASGKRCYGYPDLTEGVAVQQLLEQCLEGK